MLSIDTRSLRLSKAWGQPIHILRQSSLPRTHLSTPPRSRRSLNTVSNSKIPTPPSLSRLIFNRTYYHKTYFSPPPPPPPSSSATTATIWTLIGLNTAIFALWQYALHQPPQPHRPHRRDDRNQLTPSLLEAHTTLSWPNLHANRPWTLLTSAFSHQDPWHFAFNMLSLKTFATILTHIPGIRAPHIISLATGSALAASFAFLSHASSRRQNQSQEPNTPIGRTISGPNRQIVRGIPGASPRIEQSPRSSALGASGMVLGFGAAATCLAPLTRMSVMFLPVPVPLWVLTVAYAAADTFFLDDARSRVGHAAHLGGTVFGVVFYLGFLRRFGGVLGRGRGW